MVDAIPGEGHDRSASEVSEDESDVAPGSPTSPDGSPLVIARQDDGGVADYGDDDDMEALGNLNHDPHLVGSIFSRRAAAERLSGLDVAARVWSTTTQLLSDSPAAHKLAWATAASKDRAYLVVMGANTSFTLVQHLTIMDVKLRPRDPILGRLVAFEADMRDDAPPRQVVFDGPATDLFQLLRPQLGSQRTADATYIRGEGQDRQFLGVRAPSDPPAEWPAVTTRGSILHGPARFRSGGTAS